MSVKKERIIHLRGSANMVWQASQAALRNLRIKIVRTDRQLRQIYARNGFRWLLFGERIAIHVVPTSPDDCNVHLTSEPRVHLARVDGGKHEGNIRKIESELTSVLKSGHVLPIQEDVELFGQDEAFSAVTLAWAVIGGLVGALIGGALWTGVLMITDTERGVVAMIVGALAGYGVSLASGRKRGVSFQVAAVLTAIVGIGIGKYLSVYFILREVLTEQGSEALATLPNLGSGAMFDVFIGYLQRSLDSLDMLFIAAAIFAAWRIPSVRAAKQPPRRTAH
jgi:hypothetical protein